MSHITSEVIPDFDPHFKIFHDLMPFKVQEILLISSLYDAFIMAEKMAVLQLGSSPNITG